MSKADVVAKELRTKYPGQGLCFSDALAKTGIDTSTTDIPIEWPTKNDLRFFCSANDLKFIDDEHLDAFELNPNETYLVSVDQGEIASGVRKGHFEVLKGSNIISKNLKVNMIIQVPNKD